MAFQSEILNTLRGTSIIRVADVGSITVALTDLRANAYTETVTEADIKRLYWSTNGAIRITRNSVPILMLHSAGEMRLDDLGYSISNNNTQSITIEVITGGSIIMEISKRATYNVDPYTGYSIP
jgi:hypothetical protein